MICSECHFEIESEQCIRCLKGKRVQPPIFEHKLFNDLLKQFYNNEISKRNRSPIIKTRTADAPQKVPKTQASSTASRFFRK